MKRALSVAVGVAALAGTSLLSAQALKVDASLPSYQKVSGVSGSLSSVGSDTMNNMMTMWAETFRKNYPNVKIQIEGKGSSTAPPGPDRGHLAVRTDVARDAGHGSRPVRSEVRLQADAAPHQL